ncbi:hypothetical protein [Methylobacterium mesophilicum]|uniref:hypothetical protein n=1 Tax=Methylobacterium mesophilicum TaxID=39956 RepID=UPI002F357D31
MNTSVDTAKISNIRTSLPINASSDTDNSNNSLIIQGRDHIDPRSGLRTSPNQLSAILVVADTNRKSPSAAFNSNIGDTASVNQSSTVPRSGVSSDEVIYRPAMEGDPTVHLPGISVGPGSPVIGYPSSPTNVGGGVGAGGGGGRGGPGSVQNTSHSNPASAEAGRTKVTWQEAQKETYDSLFDENPRNARIGDHDTGAVAIGENSGSDPDGSIWSHERIIFHTEKGTFFAAQSVPGDVVVARFVNVNLEVTTQTPT